MITVIVALVIIAVVTGAGVFEVVAGGAVSEVQIELLADFLGVLTDLNGDDDWKIVALRKSLVRDEGVSVFFKLHPDRILAISGDDIDTLLGKRNGFTVVVDRRDFDFAILGDEELKVRLDFGENAAAIWTGHFFSVVMAFVVVMIVILMICVFLVGVVFLLLVCEDERSCRDSAG